MHLPTRQDVYRARRIVHRHLAPTPLIRSAARKLGARLRGQTVVLIVSGCNITREQLARVLTDPQPW